MSGSFDLVLDTTAPQVTWGASVGDAGQRFQVGYVVDEPGIENATITLADGRVLTLVDTGTTLECDLPPDAPAGWATVRADVVDDVLNRATWTYSVLISGVIAIPQGEPMLGRPPSRRPVRPRRRLRATASTRVRSHASATSSQHVEVAIAVFTSARAGATSTSSSQARFTVTSRLTANRESTAAIRTLGRKGTVTRRDGPDLEALLLL